MHILQSKKYLLVLFSPDSSFYTLLAFVYKNMDQILFVDIFFFKFGLLLVSNERIKHFVRVIFFHHGTTTTTTTALLHFNTPPPP